MLPMGYLFIEILLYEVNFINFKIKSFINWNQNIRSYHLMIIRAKLKLCDWFVVNSIFSDRLQLYWNRDTGSHTLLDFFNPVLKRIRWFSVGSQGSTAHWMLFCSPVGKYMCVNNLRI